MTVQEIPLSGQPQTLTVSLSGTPYQLTLAYLNVPNGGWILNIADNQGNPLVQSLPLVTGVDLLGQYGYLGIPGALVVQTDNDPTAVPAFANLGQEAHLYYVTPS